MAAAAAAVVMDRVISDLVTSTILALEAAALDRSHHHLCSVVATLEVEVVVAPVVCSLALEPALSVAPISDNSETRSDIEVYSIILD